MSRPNVGPLVFSAVLGASWMLIFGIGGSENWLLAGGIAATVYPMGYFAGRNRLWEPRPNSEAPAPSRTSAP